MSTGVVSVSDRLAAAKIFFEKAQKDALIDYPPSPDDVVFTPPFSGSVGFYDGIFVAVVDSKGERVADIYDLVSAAELIQRLNNAALASQPKE